MIKTDHTILGKKLKAQSIKLFKQPLFLAFGFMLCAFSLKAQTYVPSGAMTGTPAAGSYYNNSSITLTNFSFTASSGNSLLIYITPCMPLSASLSGTQNYISTIVPRIAAYNPAISTYTTCDAMQTVQYIDGLGRPLQTVQVKGNPDASKDVITPNVYDAFGREAVKYLPYTQSTSTPGAYRPAAITEQAGFYGLSNQNYKNITSPFAITVFEPSPLNRVLEQGAPGDAWQPASSRTSTAGRTVALVYTSNNDTVLTDTAHTRRVALYTATINSNGSRTLARAGSNTAIYAANQLTVTISKDENWTSGRAGTMEEYKDKEGHVVLKRTFNYKSGALEMLSTYYVYDDLGQLAFVLPSGADPDAASTITQTTLDNLCYQYSYDERKRLSQKKLPGKGWEYMVYNQLDQVVLSQDALQRAGNQWTVTKYDALGRTIMTGLWNAGSTIAQSTLQASIYAGAQYDVRDYGSTTTGYTISSYPSTLNDILSISYYDDYSIPNLPAAYTSSSYSSMTRGLPTAGKTAILNPSGTVSTDMLWSVQYYDDKGRNVKSYAQHYLGGVVSNYNYDDITTAYDFTNAVTATTRQHHTAAASGAVALTVANTYEYDHMGRKVKSWEQINGGTNVLLSKTDFNEVGQLYTKHLHSANGGTSFLQDVTYSYNERGWLSKSNAGLFEEQLQYNIVNNISMISPAAQYNGNIASQSWGTSAAPNTTSYTYTYDRLNRLTSGISTNNYNESNITYDMLGNIKTLQRTWNGSSNIIDNLTYTYAVSGNNTNQLQSVSDASGDTGPFGFKTGSYTYSYDGNGNMTADNSKALTVNYNLFNLPRVNTLPGGTISYTYNAAGQKLRKVSTIGSGTTTDYIGGIQYEGNSISFVQTEEGRVLNPATSPNYEYSLTDHLGNSRVNFDTGSGTANATQTDNYLPFGMAVQPTTTSPANNYLYNKKELQVELGQYDYGARFYDPVVGRWTSVDPLAEKDRRFTPYNYGLNNPIRMIDPDGMFGDFFDRQGNYLGSDGNDDGKIYLLKEGTRPKTENKNVNWGGTLSKTPAEDLKKHSEELGGLILMSRTAEGIDKTGKAYTTGEYAATDGTVSASGVMLEPGGPETTQQGQNKRIPVGVYNLKKRIDGDHIGQYELSNKNVPSGRHILEHTGNTAGDTEGCILPGLYKEGDGVWDSAKAAQGLTKYIDEHNSKEKPVKIIIRDYIKENKQ